MKTASSWLLLGLLALNISAFVAFHQRFSALEASAKSIKDTLANLPQPAAPIQQAPTPAAPERPAATPIDGTDEEFNALKEQYETAMVLYFSMQKCGKAAAADYHIINSNLSQDMATINAPGRLQYDILTAAKGSFESLYASSPCEGKEFAERETQFRSYVDTLTKRNNVP